MTLRVIGAGVGRTGTLSLKAGLERLLGAPCYHMAEVYSHPEHVATWRAAFDGEPVDWQALFQGYEAAVDWPGAACWRELMDVYPDAPVLLSHRSPESWWQSASHTIFQLGDRTGPWREMVQRMLETRFTPKIDDREACIAAFEAHNARVRALVPASRLVEWRAQDGYAPLCRALGLPQPSEPFPHLNTTQDFRSRFGQT